MKCTSIQAEPDSMVLLFVRETAYHLHVCACALFCAESCDEIGGACVPFSSCTEHIGTAFPSKCPGSSQIVCCAVVAPPAKDVVKHAVKKTELKHPTWRKLVRNRISDIADYLIANMSSPCNLNLFVSHDDTSLFMRVYVCVCCC